MAKKWSMKDCDMRPIVFEYFESINYKCRFFEELCIGKTRADAILVTTDTIYGFEFKSDCDSTTRLLRQINDYERFCDLMYVVCGNKLLDKVNELIPPHWGIINIEETNNKYTLNIVRYPTETKKRYRLHNQLRLLWRCELIPFVKKFKLGGVSKKNKLKLVKTLESALSKEVLKAELCDILINRDYSIFDKTKEDDIDKAE